MTRKPGLDLLRAVAIVWVMVFHSYLAGYMGGGMLRWGGWMGVDLFFALSGFLIGSQIFRPLARGDRPDLVDFYLRRSFRTLPAFFVVLAIYVAWPSMREAPGMMPLWQFLTYTLNLFIRPGHEAFSHAWSLCVEEQFYVVFPMLALLLAKGASWRRNVLVFGAFVAGGMALRAGLWMHFVEPVLARKGDAGSIYLRVLYVPTYARLDDLLVGVTLAALRSHRTRAWTWIEAHPNRVAVLGMVLTTACVIGFDGRRMTFTASVLGYPALALAMGALVAAAAAERGVLARLRVPGAQWLALSSYSLYLSHKMVYGQLHGRLAHWVDGHGLGTVALYVMSVLGAGAMLHYSVEHPFLKLREPVRRMWAARRQSTAEPVPGVEATDVTPA